MTSKSQVNLLPSFGLWIVFSVVVGAMNPICAQEKKVPAATQIEIDNAINRGARWLIGVQQVDGGWKGPYPNGFQSGMTGLAVYALLKTGMPADHRVIRKGLAFMNSKACVLTYEVGTNLLAYAALPESARPKKRIRQLTELLIQTLDEDGWRYNRPKNNVVDLSNGQYALLGLRAAAAMGEKIPAGIWERAAEIFMRLQGHYGGWAYTPKQEWTDAGMTSAGVFCLAVCHEQLKSRKKSRKIVRDLKSRIDLGLSWFEKNWSVAKNTILPSKEAPRFQWHYHYLYGLERVAALTQSNQIGGHDWYGEGATWLVKKQSKSGSWSTAYGISDVDSCLALLFLARGTQITSTKARDRSPLDGKSTETLTVRSNGKNPMVAWIMKLDKKVQRRLEVGEKIAFLTWEVNGLEVKRMAVSNALAIRDEATFFSHEFVANGKHDVCAKLIFVDGAGENCGDEISAPVTMWVDDVEGPADVEAIADVGKNRLQGIEVIATATSQLTKKSGPEAAVDGIYATSWIAAETDKSPRMDITLGKRVRASVLKLVGAYDYGKQDDNWARPKDIEIVVNGRKKILVTLPDDVRRKHTVEIGKLTVRRLRVTIKSTYPGKSKASRVGIKEIELFK